MQEFRYTNYAQDMLFGAGALAHIGQSLSALAGKTLAALFDRHAAPQWPDCAA